MCFDSNDSSKHSYPKGNRKNRNNNPKWLVKHSRHGLILNIYFFFFLSLLNSTTEKCVDLRLTYNYWFFMILCVEILRCDNMSVPVGNWLFYCNSCNIMNRGNETFDPKMSNHIRGFSLLFLFLYFFYQSTSDCSHLVCVIFNVGKYTFFCSQCCMVLFCNTSFFIIMRIQREIMRDKADDISILCFRYKFRIK